MKKLLTVVLAIAMIASIVSVSSFAADLNKVNIKAVSVDIEVGAATVEVPIVAEYSGNNGLAAFRFKVDAQGLTLAKLVAGDAVTGNKMVQGNEIFGMTKMGDDDRLGSIPSGTVVAVATFSIPKDVRDGDQFKVVITPDSDASNFMDASENDQQGVGVSGIITVFEKLNEVNIKAGNVEVRQGAATVEVPIVAEYEGTNGLSAFKFKVDAAGLTLDKLAFGESIGGQKMSMGNSIFALSVDSNANPVSIPSGTVIAVATFSVPKGVSIGDTFEIVITPDTDSSNFCDKNENPQKGVGVNGSVTVVKSFTSGDVNDDGRVNAKDIIAVMKYMLGNTTNGFIFEAADMDANGRVNAKDIISIMKKMLEK